MKLVSSEACTFQGFDIISAYFPEGHYVPRVTSPPYPILPWNNHKQNNIENMFKFAFGYLTNDGFLNLFVPKKKMLEMM